MRKERLGGLLLQPITIHSSVDQSWLGMRTASTDLTRIEHSKPLNIIINNSHITTISDASRVLLCYSYSLLIIAIVLLASCFLLLACCFLLPASCSLLLAPCADSILKILRSYLSWNTQHIETSISRHNETIKVRVLQSEV